MHQCGDRSGEEQVVPKYMRTLNYCHPLDCCRSKFFFISLGKDQPQFYCQIVKWPIKSYPWQQTMTAFCPEPGHAQHTQAPLRKPEDCEPRC
ncbi:hypothetical protein BaRGS_00009261 [Batillaria attramentaria]|uniref:Uncharacterized protein n=1 Tax=Batillaria attramentaria TaxID=370345 RepID=A0ABD0LJB6_9CAEN